MVWLNLTPAACCLLPAGLAAVGPAVSLSLSLRVGSAVGRHEQVQQESTSGWMKTTGAWARGGFILC